MADAKFSDVEIYTTFHDVERGQYLVVLVDETVTLKFPAEGKITYDQPKRAVLNSFGARLPADNVATAMNIAHYRALGIQWNGISQINWIPKYMKEGEA